MCLLNVDYHTKHIKTGYKVVKKRPAGIAFDEQGELTTTATYYPECYGIGKALPFNKWIDEKNYRSGPGLSDNMIHADRGGRYPSGFHTFVTRQAAKVQERELVHCETALVKVKIRNCVASGYQRFGKFGCKHFYYRVVVAKQIKLVEVL